MATDSIAIQPSLKGLRAQSLVDTDWKALRYFNVYRSVLSGLLVVLVLWGLAPRSIGHANVPLFQVAAVVYLGFSIAASFTIRWRYPAFDVQVFLQVIGDIVVITLLMHASGGVTSGFGMLLVVAIAGGSILTHGRIAVLFAAMASLAVLSEQIYTRLYGSLATANYTHAGILGATFFAAALLAHISVRRVRASEALVAKREVDLANLAQLNEHIIQRMQSGILVIDRDGRIRLHNESALNLLGLPRLPDGGHLSASAPRLHELLHAWRADLFSSSKVFRPMEAQLDVLASFAGVGQGARDGVIIFLEDASAMTQRAQELKLASLGRLTASIAHEIRNPLGAISHAEQLLTESMGLTGADRRLTRIISDNCRRMNMIIEDVLQLSRRKPALPESLPLKQWVESFVTEFNDNKTGGGALVSAVDAQDLHVRFDPDQLHQVVSNLIENGLRHAGENSTMEVRAGMQAETQRPYLDVTDNGAGIAPGDVEHIFEPFYTTRPDGTGLGLYIARELCEANQAALSFMPAAAGCRFRITFADPRRQGGLPS